MTKVVIMLFVFRGANMLITNRRTGEINESWTAVFVFLGVRKLTAVTTKFLTVYFRFFLAMYPAMTLSVSIVTFLKFLLVFRQNKKNCIERAPIYRRNIVCPCNVYN